MDKGTRVQIVKGRKGLDVKGSVFWEGPNKFGEGTRLGIKGDDGETYWVSADYVEEIDEAEPAAYDGPNLKGSRVQYKGGYGDVVWFGDSKFGDGKRCGIRMDDGDEDQLVWADARHVTVVDDDAAAPAPAPAAGGNDDGDMPPMGMDLTAYDDDDDEEIPF